MNFTIRGEEPAKVFELLKAWGKVTDEQPIIEIDSECCFEKVGCQISLVNDERGLVRIFQFPAEKMTLIQVPDFPSWGKVSGCRGVVDVEGIGNLLFMLGKRAEEPAFDEILKLY